MMNAIPLVVLATAIAAAAAEKISTGQGDHGEKDTLEPIISDKRSSLFNGASCSGVLQIFGIDDLFSDLNDTKEAVLQELEDLKSSKRDSTPDYDETSWYDLPVGEMSISEAGRREYLQELQEKTTLTMIPALVGVILIAVVGVIGNSLVLYIYSTKFPLNGTRVFILVIAGFDLFINVVVLPGVVYNMFHIWDFDQSWLCKLRMYINGVTTLVSAQLLTGLAVIRYRKVCVSTGWQITARHAKFISWAIVIACCILSIPYAFVRGKRTLPTPRPGINGYGCDVDDAYVGTLWPLAQSALFIFLYLGNSTTIVVLYSLVGLKALRHNRKFERSISLERASIKSGAGGTPTLSRVDSKNSSVRKDDVGVKFSEDNSESSVKILKSQRSVSFAKGTSVKRSADSEGGEDKKDAGSGCIEEDRNTTVSFADDEETEKTHSLGQPSASEETVDLHMVSELTTKLEAVQKTSSHEEITEGQTEKSTEEEEIGDMDPQKVDCNMEEVSTGQISGRGENGSRNDVEINSDTQPINNTKELTFKCDDKSDEEDDAHNQKKKPKGGKSSKSGSLSFARRLTQGSIFVSRSRNGSVQSPRPARNLNRTTYMLVMISAVYVLGYIPFLGLSIYFAVNPAAKDSLNFTGHVLTNIFFRFHCLNFAANAVIYYIFDLSFRDHCKNTLYNVLYARGSRQLREPSSSTN